MPYTSSFHRMKKILSVIRDAVQGHNMFTPRILQFLLSIDHRITILLYKLLNPIALPFKVICFFNKGILGIILFPIIYILLRLANVFSASEIIPCIVFHYAHQIYFLMIFDGMFVGGIKHILKRDRPEKTIHVERTVLVVKTGAGTCEEQTSRKVMEKTWEEESSPRGIERVLEESETAETSSKRKTRRRSDSERDSLIQRQKRVSTDYSSAASNSPPSPAPMREQSPSLYETLVQWKRVRDEFSFPSGHSSKSALFAGVYLYICLEENIKIPLVALILFVANALFTGIGRVALGRHFFTDVVCGWIIGFCEGAVFPYLCQYVWASPR